MTDSSPLSMFENWYASLKIVKANGGPANGTIAAALVVLERLKQNFNLNFDSHIAPGGMQISGASGSAVAEILRRHGEIRPFAREGGRTNRGGPGEIKSLLNSLIRLGLDTQSEETRNAILESFQQFLVDRVKDFHNRQKIKLVFDAKLSTWQIVKNLLDAARNEGKDGTVAQHLVGAKLKLRFPELEIENNAASTADRPTGRHGDFFVGETAFHVTVAPMTPVFEKCLLNVKEGFKAYVVVPAAKLNAAREMAQQICGGQIAVESLESFVSQNIDELSQFKGDNLKINFVELVKIYNARVDAVEIDKSLMIELPSSLEK